MKDLILAVIKANTALVEVNYLAGAILQSDLEITPYDKATLKTAYEVIFQNLNVIKDQITILIQEEKA